MVDELQRDGTDFLDLRVVRHRSGKDFDLLYLHVYWLFFFGTRSISSFSMWQDSPNVNLGVLINSYLVRILLCGSFPWKCS